MHGYVIIFVIHKYNFTHFPIVHMPKQTFIPYLFVIDIGKIKNKEFVWTSVGKHDYQAS